MSRPLDKFLTGDLVRTSRPRVTTSDIIRPPVDSNLMGGETVVKPGGGAKQFVTDLADGLRMVKEALIGRPEDSVMSTGDLVEMRSLPIVDGRSMAIPVPTARGMGAFDALTAGLPFIGGTVGRTGRRFFSQLEKVIGERLPAKVTTKHLLDVARKGAKAEELKWSGIEDLVRNTPADQLWKRDDLLAHAEKNLPEIRERLIGGPITLAEAGDIAWRDKPQSRYADKVIFESTDGQFVIHAPDNLGSYEVFRQTPNGPEYVGYGTTPEGAKRQAAHADAVRNLKHPKFTTYTLPGGENHRELVVTMPAKKETTPRKTEIPLDFETWRNLPENRGWYDEPGHAEEAYQQYLDADTADEFGQNAGKGNYQVPAGHAYGDPELDVNRLFHLRMNDRDGGRTLFMEELQSDWHQTGRESGYNVPQKLKPPPGFEARRVTQSDLDNWADEIDNDGVFDADDVRPEIGDWILAPRGESNIMAHSPKNLNDEEALLDLQGQVADEEIWPEVKTGGIPDAPFKNTWQELGFRRMLQEAVDNPSYERLAWTTGAQQADRYKLSNHVDIVHYNPSTGQLLGFKGKSNVPIVSQNVPKDKLAGYVGKEVAEKLAIDRKAAMSFDEWWNHYDDNYPSSQGTPDGGRTIKNGITKQSPAAKAEYKSYVDQESNNVLQGVDLDLGGEGMKGFYDKMLVDYANKVGKKYGVKVEKHKIPIPNKMMNAKSNKVLSDADWRDLIEDRRQEITRGEIAKIRHLPDEQVKQWAINEGQASPISIKIYGIETMRKAMEDNALDVIDRLKNSEIADMLTKDGVVKQATEEVWQLPITDEMRRDLREKGQQLFAAPPVGKLPESKEKKQNRRIQDLMDLAPSLSRAHTTPARRR